MPRSTLELLLGGDAAYYEGLRAAVCTVILFLDERAACRINILDCGLTPSQRAHLHSEIERIGLKRPSMVSLHWVDVDLSQFQALPKFGGDSLAAYARVLAPDLLKCSEVIWIDADILVLQDISTVFKHVETSSLVAGVVDTVVQKIQNDPVSANEDVRDDRYINTGFLWMNLDALRKENFSARAIDLMNASRDCLIYADQGPINALTHDRRSILPPSFNQLIHENSSFNTLFESIGSGNLHFAGRVKPWLNVQRSDLLAQRMVFYRVLNALNLKPFETLSEFLCERPSHSAMCLLALRSLLLRNRRKFNRARVTREAIKKEAELYERVDQLFACD
ncbi:MAG TPA: hypothetical protein DCX06_13600 [Opitutae bacterium]|nr:hypothetical protein [Opitutae bacterium]